MKLFQGLLIVALIGPSVGAMAQDLPAGLTRSQVEAHQFEPAYVQGVLMDGQEPERSLVIARRALPAFATTPKLDVEEFGKAFHAAIKDRVTGYAFQLRKNGAPAYTLIWNWARTPADGSKGWKLDTRMHVASVSKYLTAIGLVKLLDAKGISYDAKIINYLPNYWVKGPNIAQISFRHLLNHTSGFNTGTSSSSFQFMKDKVKAGVPGVGPYDYENMNFGLCRILMAVINGNISPAANYGPLNDQIWDMLTIGFYKQYMQTKVFSPAGVANASFEPLAMYPNALAYKFPHGGENGWDSGNLASMAGGAAWRLSVSDVLNVMDHVRRRNTILPAAKAQMMLDSKFGIDQVIDTPAGKLYNKNGSWNSNGRKEQCVAYFLPGGMELVVFVNSKIGNEDASLRTLVKDVYLNNLVAN